MRIRLVIQFLRGLRWRPQKAKVNGLKKKKSAASREWREKGRSHKPSHKPSHEPSHVTTFSPLISAASAASTTRTYSWREETPPATGATLSGGDLAASVATCGGTTGSAATADETLRAKHKIDGKLLEAFLGHSLYAAMSEDEGEFMSGEELAEEIERRRLDFPQHNFSGRFCSFCGRGSNDDKSKEGCSAGDYARLPSSGGSNCCGRAWSFRFCGTCGDGLGGKIKSAAYRLPTWAEP